MAGEPDETPADATPFVPDTRDLEALRRAAAGCRGCDLYGTATQTIFGEGPAVPISRSSARCPATARTGRAMSSWAPPVASSTGPCARRASTATRSTSPIRASTSASRNRQAPDPPAPPSLGGARAQSVAAGGARGGPAASARAPGSATAGGADLGPGFNLKDARGRRIDSDLAEFVTATVHASAIVRLRDRDARSAECAAFAEDLRTAARAAAGS